MRQTSIKRISFIGFVVLIAGSTLSGGVLLTLLFNLEQIKAEQQITEDAYDTMFELKYYTERLLTTHNLEDEKGKWKDVSDRSAIALDILLQQRDDKASGVRGLWRVIGTEVEVILNQLENPLFQAKNTMDKSLLRRLGEGLNANEQSDYYVSLTALNNSIDYLKQYESFLLDELHDLRQKHAVEVESRMANTMYLAVVLPVLILLLTLGFAILISRLLGRVEFKLLTTQKDLQHSLDRLSSQKDELDYLAHHDTLTRLPNRMLLLDRIGHAIKKAKRSSKGVALMFIDLDSFKEVNDSLGHSIGDEMLNVVAERLMRQLREEDTIARLGGDEFVVVLEDVDALQSVNFIAQKILFTIQEPIPVGEHSLYITTSIGVSVYPEDGESAEELLRNADSAMYRAKDEGKNTFRFYTADMTRRALERVVMMTQMRQGLKNNEFLVHYQPQYNLKTGKLTGLEALLRWDNPNSGMIPPGNFIPLAEETGYIVPLGEWVLRSVCKQVYRWRSKGLDPGRVAVNLSVKQLLQQSLFRTVQQILRETGCDPHWLELEVTEGFIMKKPEESIGILNQFSFFGIELSIDDFGTGYSSFSYLKRLPISKIKIDRSFIDGLPDDGDDAAITRAVIAMAEEMKLEVLAEGVETQPQKEFLIREGCLNAQGYLMARPMPAEDIEILLKQDLYLVS